MIKQNVVHVPKGWTYLSHGTNTTEFNQDLSNSDSFVTKGNLSCVDIEHLLQELESGYNSVNGNAQRKGEPFEIRCLIYQECMRHVDKHGLKGRLTADEIKDIYRYYATFLGRNECVPRNTKLIKIATSEKNELTGESRKVYWFVPEKYYEHYMEDIQKYPDKTIELSTQEPEVEKAQLPGWDLRNWNLTPTDVQAESPQPKKDIKDALKEYNGDNFATQNVQKLEDTAIRQSLLNHYGMSLDAKIDIFLVGLEDAETGNSGYCLYMMDKNGKLKELKLPISQTSREVIVDSKPQAIRMSDNKIMYSPGKQAEGIVSWKLQDGLELTVFKTEDGQVRLGKEDKNGRTNFVESVNSKDMLNRDQFEGR